MTIERRTFLKGLGLSMGLPLLEAMTDTSTLAVAAENEPPVRMAYVFFPNGAIMPSWTPEGDGSDYELSETLKHLEPHKADFNIFTGLAQDNGRAKGDGPGDHARCASTYLTGAHPVKTSSSNIKVGISVDQVAAEQIGKQTKLPSLELCVEPGGNSGNCDSGYSCAYSNNISWKTPTTPMAKEINPRLVFERMFGSAEASKGKAERDFFRKSVLDLVAGDAAKLKTRLGLSDRRKIDEYFTSVRELEQRILRAERGAEGKRPEMEAPSGIPSDFEEHIRLMYDLLVLAFRTDSTRVATFMLARAGSNRTYPMVGVNDGHHSLSHHQSMEQKVDKLRKIDGFLATSFGYFLGKLKEVKEGEGTLLDNSMIMYGSGLGDGNRHNHDKLPILLAGGGGGTIKTGRHVVFEQETPLNNLFMAMLDRVGAKIESFGDSTGRLERLT